MTLGAVILAGGASERMGRPKALLPLGTETFVGRLVRVLGEVAGAAHIRVVTGAAHEGIAAALQSSGIVLVRNPDPSRGQLSSLQCGLASLDLDRLDAFYFVPVDCPGVSPRTLQQLRDQLENNPEALLAAPRCQGRRGHPVLCRVGVAKELLELPATAQAREVIRRRRPETVYVDTDDEGVLQDIDLPEDYRRLVAER